MATEQMVSNGRKTPGPRGVATVQVRIAAEAMDRLEGMREVLERGVRMSTGQLVEAVIAMAGEHLGEHLEERHAVKAAG